MTRCHQPRNRHEGQGNEEEEQEQAAQMMYDAKPTHCGPELGLRRRDFFGSNCTPWASRLPRDQTWLLLSEAKDDQVSDECKDAHRRADVEKDA
ncbi:MAG: hypothetical protein U0572_11380 [Phycisphaerales bacterium]